MSISTSCVVLCCLSIWRCAEQSSGQVAKPLDCMMQCMSWRFKHAGLLCGATPDERLSVPGGGSRGCCNGTGICTEHKSTCMHTFKASLSSLAT
jgi:hypothetical protein